MQRAPLTSGRPSGTVKPLRFGIATFGSDFASSTASAGITPFWCSRNAVKAYTSPGASDCGRNTCGVRLKEACRACERLCIAFLPWYPLGGGRGVRSSKIGRIAERHGVTPAQVALAWVLQRSPAMLPIPGTQSMEHLEENLCAAALTLSPEDVDDLAFTHR